MMQSFSEKFIFVWESADLVISSHALLSSKMRDREHPSFFTRPPSPLNLKTVSGTQPHYEAPGNLHIRENTFLTLYAPIPQNGQTHSNNSSAIGRRIV